MDNLFLALPDFAEAALHTLVSAGVELKDILLEVEGEPIEGHHGLSRLMRPAESGRRVFIILAIVHRRGRIGFLRFTLTGNRCCDEGRP